MTDIPARLVDAAALAIAARFRVTQHGQLCPVYAKKANMDTCDCWILPNACTYATAALAAVFAECQVREEWREVGEYTGQDGKQYAWPYMWRPDRPDPKPYVDNWHLVRRLVITTPPWEGEGE